VIGANPWFTEALRSISRDGGRFRLALVAEDTDAFTRRPEARDVEIAILACRACASEGPRLLAWVRRHAPGLRVVLKYPALRAHLVRDAIQMGAWGCFGAEDPPETLMTVLASVAQGRVSFPFVDFGQIGEDPFERLTRREYDVLRALAEGWTNAQISTRLGISPNTVKYHLQLIYDKLGVSNRSAAVARFLSRAQP